MRALKWICVSLLVAFAVNAGNVEELTLCKMTKNAIFAKNGTSLDTYNNITNIRIDCFIKCEDSCQIYETNLIKKIMSTKYRTGNKRTSKWEDFYDCNYAHGYWAFFDRKGEEIFMLCYFDKEESGYNRNSSFWCVIGMTNLGCPGEIGIGQQMYQLIENKQWEGTFESKELEELLINKASGRKGVVFRH